MNETLPLSDELLRTLAETFHNHELTEDPYRARYRRALEMVTRVRGWSDDELRQPQAQMEIWESDAMGSVGSGKLVDTHGIANDAHLIETLVELRTRSWPEQTEERVRAIGDAYESLLEEISARLGTRRPRAKLLRVMATLLPEHLNRCFDQGSQRQLSRLLGTRWDGRVQASVRTRQRLREVLGAETSLGEHVERSLLCWWLSRQYESLSQRLKPNTAAPNATAEHHSIAEALITRASYISDTGQEEPPLTLWSFKRQRKGIGATSGYVDTLLAIVQACEGGATQEDIIIALHEYLPDLKSASLRGLLSTTRALDLIQHRDGLWYPSPAGEEALDNEPPDILVERMLERIFGMAQLLRVTADQNPRQPAEIYDALRALYPNWQSDFTPSALLAWGNNLELLERRDDKRWQITEYGRYWAQRLPDALPKAPSVTDGGDAEDIALATRARAAASAPLIPGQARAPWQPPAFADIWAEFQSDSALSRFVFDKSDVLALHLAWHPAAEGDPAQSHKRFVILSGLSGTGKSALLVHYARIYCRLVAIERPDAHYTMVAVSPDWRDPSGLLGYVNTLSSDPTYLREPTLVHLLAANDNPHLPYFLLLDEMNLAHPEHYFAPFLSAMETGGRLDLHAHSSPLLEVPNAIPWPRNLFIGGTVNMDETTHSFSDKVLDRAFTIEFWSVDLNRFFAARRQDDVADVANIDQVYAMFIELNQALFNVRRHVGYRSVGEAIDFVRAAARGGHVTDNSLWQFVDQAVHAKVLPRLRGHDDDGLRAALQAAHNVCEQRNLSRCVAKLKRMYDMLNDTGVTRFFA